MMTQREQFSKGRSPAPNFRSGLDRVFRWQPTMDGARVCHPRSGGWEADSAPGGSRNGGIGIGAYSTSTISRCSLLVGARTTTRSPGAAFISARAKGDIQLMYR